MCLVVLIFLGHSQIGMLLLFHEEFRAPLASSSPGQSGPGWAMDASYIHDIVRRARMVGRAAVLCSFPCGARMPCTAVSSILGDGLHSHPQWVPIRDLDIYR